MQRSLASITRRAGHQAARSALALLPRHWRFALYRHLVDCDPQPDARLQLKIADTQDELEACFRLLHDAYVAAGFMQPDPSGLRVTIYHALPTTTTLCAKWDGEVVGTLSMIREGVFGFPLQSAFNLDPVRARAGRIAEISALAVAPAFRKTGGKILFPLMKFMSGYCTRYFDTRHIIIAVNPNKIELYESLLFFDRLQAEVVDSYDFANGAPAVGATLDLEHAVGLSRQVYGHRADRQNLFRYFFDSQLPNIQAPARRFFTTNDPVLTPAMMDYFFNQRTQVFSTLDNRKRLLLRSIYGGPGYAAVLPVPAASQADDTVLRQHRRFSIRCPARLVVSSYGGSLSYPLQITDISQHGCRAEGALPLPEGTTGRLEVALGHAVSAQVEATALRRQEQGGVVAYGFWVARPDAAWQRCVAALDAGQTHADLVDLAAPPAQTGAAAGELRVPGTALPA